MTQQFPGTPGIDASGVIDAVGDGVELAVGDAIFGVGRATYAEHAILTAAAVDPVPMAVPPKRPSAVSEFGSLNLPD